MTPPDPTRIRRVRGRDRGDEDLRGRVGEPGRGVVLGEPVAVVAEPVGGLREVEGLPDRLGRGLAFPDRGLVQDAQAEGGWLVAGHTKSLARPRPIVLARAEGARHEGWGPYGSGC